MQINTDRPKPLALQLSQSLYPATKAVTRLPDWVNFPVNSPVNAATQSIVPDVIDFLDDLAQRRAALLEQLRSPSAGA
jgi:hypothetical protein